MTTNRKLAALNFLSAACSVLLIVVGTIWYAFNFLHEPHYGDAAEYWHLSETLALDSWRTILYPLLLKAAGLFGERDTARAIAYGAQILMSFMSCWYLIYSLNLLVKLPVKQRRRLALFGAITVLTVPLVAHYNTATLSDSMAASLFMVWIAAVMRIMLIGDYTRVTLAIAGMATFLTGLSRQDRLLQLIAILLIFAVFAWSRHRQKLLVVMSALLLVAGGTWALNKATQTASLNRPQLSVEWIIFDRTARGHLAELMPLMPSVIQERISPELARGWDGHQPYWIQMNEKLDDPAGRQALLAGAKVAVKHRSLATFGSIVVESSGFLFAPFTYAIQTLDGTDAHFWTHWTNTRMGMRRVRLTAVYNKLFMGVLGVWSIILVLRKDSFKKVANGKGLALFMLTIITVITLVHTVLNSLGFHVRFALPIFVLEISILVWAGTLCFQKSLAKKPANSPPNSRFED